MGLPLKFVVNKIYVFTYIHVILVQYMYICLLREVNNLIINVSNPFASDHTPNANKTDHSVGARNKSHEGKASQS